MSMEKKNLWIILIIAAFVVGIGGGLGLGALLGGGSTGGKGTINLYPPTKSQARGPWLVKIDNYVITKAEVEDGIELLLTQIPEEQKAQMPDNAALKKQYMDTLIGQYVVLFEALKSDFMKDDAVKLMVMSSLRKTIVDAYAQTKLKDPTVFYPTKVEEEQFFKQYRSQMQKMGYTAAQMKQVAQQELAKQKMQVWQQGFITDIRDKFNIEKNTALLEKEGLGDNQVPGGLQLPNGMLPQQ